MFPEDNANNGNVWAPTSLGKLSIEGELLKAFKDKNIYPDRKRPILLYPREKMEREMLSCKDAILFVH